MSAIMSSLDDRCDRCGHTSGYHGATFCMMEAGAPHRRMCDCRGWRRDVDDPAIPLLSRWLERINLLRAGLEPSDGYGYARAYLRGSEQLERETREFVSQASKKQ